ncbi:hypothetical protein B5V01_13920 [Mesorhizobium erdmanii]|uniref:Uncharacterized protein n=2 Tax=Mesorhizobium TaxID=68287 RepID=A0A3M9X7U8_9HYPH|nr:MULTISPECIES: hypothetical protein [Mesorhizobium]RNJ43752.1 hypothetical protein DNR46_19360 [Mesorhizobium japonicum]RXT45173.1 hypothetical protein B5V01_13920 [Mesorhizobium erdmanii]
MTVKPPDNSTILVATNGRDQIISIPYPKRPFANYLIGIFVLCWLGGWAFGEITAAYQLATRPFGGPTAFVAFWLCAWTVGGIFAMLMVRRIFRRPVPEVIRLDAAGVSHDPGLPPFKMPSYGTSAWTQLFSKRTERRFDRMQLKSLRLRDGDTHNRLTVDAGAQRVEIGSAATDVEREWLFKLLSDRYSPTVPQ